MISSVLSDINFYQRKFEGLLKKIFTFTVFWYNNFYCRVLLSYQYVLNVEEVAMRKVDKKQKTMRIVVFFALIIPLLFMGCSPKVSWISAQPKEKELNKLGETFQIQAVALDKENSPVPNAVIQWVSSNPAVVEVSNTGLLTAKGSGNSVITLTSPNTDAKAVIQCKVSILEAIKVEPEQLELKVGEKHALEAKVLNEKNELFEDQVVGWASSDDKVVFIDDLGNITAVTPGQATITATTPGKGLANVYGKATVTVKQ